MSLRGSSSRLACQRKLGTEGRRHRKRGNLVEQRAAGREGKKGREGREGRGKSVPPAGHKGIRESGAKTGTDRDSQGRQNTHAPGRDRTGTNRSHGRRNLACRGRRRTRCSRCLQAVMTHAHTRTQAATMRQAKAEELHDLLPGRIWAVWLRTRTRLVPCTRRPCRRATRSPLLASLMAPFRRGVCKCTYTRTHARTHARAHTDTHTHTRREILVCNSQSTSFRN